MKSTALAWSSSLAVTLTLVLPLVQCSVVTSFDGLSGGDRDAGSMGTGGSWGENDATAAHVDAATPPADAEVSAIADDAAALDSMTTTTSPVPRPDSGSDAAIDAGDAAADSAFPVANDDAGTDAAVDAAVLVFADDFQGPAALPRAWDSMTTLGGTLALDTSTSSSPSTSWLEATAFPLDAGAPGDAVDVALRKRFPMPAPGATVAYDFTTFIQAYDEASYANVVLAALQIADDGGDLYELQIDGRLSASAGELTIIFAEYGGLADGGTTYVAHPVSATLPTAAWTPVRIELTLAQPPLARLYFDGALELETTVTIPIVGTATQIALGITYASAPTQSWVVSYESAQYWAPP